MPKPENVLKNKMKKGETRNPNGRPKKLVSGVIFELREQGIKETTKEEIKAVYLMLLNLNHAELTHRSKDPEQPALVRIVSKAILSDKGFEVIEKVLDRSIGKAVQPLEGELGTIVVKVGGKG